MRTFWRGFAFPILTVGIAMLTSSCDVLSDDAKSSDKAAEARYLDGNDGKDWPGPGRTYGEQHYSPLTKLDAENVSRLGLAWSLDLPPGYSVTQPVAVDGKLYFTSGLGTVNAVDVRTGERMWTYDAEVWKGEQAKVRTAWGSRGVAWWSGNVFIGTLDGRLIAVDARTGKENWSVQTTEKGDGRFITGAPRAFDGKVIIGHGGADSAPVRAYVTAYDAATGKQLWRFFLVPGNPADGFEDAAMEMAAKTWHGEWWKYGGGGTAWNAMSYDPETRTVFLGTGNGAPWNHKVRSQGKGDNLFLSSIVALDADTGAYKWHYQTNPAESWDYNAAMDMEFADLEIDGKLRKVLLTAPKNGFFYIIDRTTGELISAEPYARVTWAKGIDLKTGRPIDVENNRYEDGKFFMAPSSVGAHSWLPMAYSPDAGLVYIPMIEMGAWMYDAFSSPEDWKRPDFHGLDGATAVELTPSEGTAALIAWDPLAQKEVWRKPAPTNVSGGVMATAGDLVFQGSVANRFNAYHAKTGKVLWSFDTKAPTIAPPISYEVDGRQYVTVLTGAGGSLVLQGESYSKSPIGYREQARRVLTFVLDGKDTLAETTPYKFEAVVDKAYVKKSDAEQRGFVVYSRTCIMCHGRDGNASGGSAPDLRASATILDREAFHSIVKGGALQQQGMPRFDDLTAAMTEDIRAYLRMIAHEAATKPEAR
ncbi:MAG: PQQ-dependent dehydrogenase, methanol/ethanol family [Sphingomonadaceae bacterium]|nr:PQQ-dependent dehydrogenase, methanol/ethanol family [Sphingomonadaceae bacterium]